MKLKHYLFAIISTLIVLGIFFASNYTPPVETYEAPVIEKRSGEEKLTDHLEGTMIEQTASRALEIRALEACAVAVATRELEDIEVKKALDNIKLYKLFHL